MKKSEVVRAWTSILAGRASSLSIEITKECPLRCPGCYAFDPAHLGRDIQLRQLSDFRCAAPVAKVLAIVDQYKRLYVSLVGVVGLAAVGHHRVLGPLTAGPLFFASERIGKVWKRMTQNQTSTTEPSAEVPFHIL